MRENCRACHTGPVAGDEIRCSHPECILCAQCHVPVSTEVLFLGHAEGFEEQALEAVGHAKKNRFHQFNLREIPGLSVSGADCGRHKTDICRFQC